MNKGKAKQRFKEEEKKTSRGRDVSDGRWPRACCRKHARVIVCTRKGGIDIVHVQDWYAHGVLGALRCISRKLVTSEYLQTRGSGRRT
jgi:hypothetical protein